MAKSPKLKHVELAGATDLNRVLSLISGMSSDALAMVKLLREDADRQIEEHRTVMQRHLDRKDLRPHANFKPLPKNHWALAFNSVMYTLGPLPNFDTLDEDDARFYWQGPDEVRHPARSMFQALVGIVQDFCNDGTQPT